MAQQYVSQNDVDVAVTNSQGAEAQENVAGAQVKQAEAALNATELDLKYTVIRSPVNGIDPGHGPVVRVRDPEHAAVVTGGIASVAHARPTPPNLLRKSAATTAE